MYPVQCSKCGKQLQVFDMICMTCESEYRAELKSINSRLYYVTVLTYAISMGALLGTILGWIMNGYWTTFDLKDDNFIYYNLMMLSLFLMMNLFIFYTLGKSLLMVLSRFVLPTVFRHEIQKQMSKDSPQG